MCTEVIFDAMLSKCGHSVCAACADKLDTCPTCRSVAVWTPNYTLRDVVEAARGNKCDVRRVENEMNSMVRTRGWDFSIEHKASFMRVVIDAIDRDLGNTEARSMEDRADGIMAHIRTTIRDEAVDLLVIVHDGDGGYAGRSFRLPTVVFTKEYSYYIFTSNKDPCAAAARKRPRVDG